MRVYKQDRIAIIGPNGVGKSTIVKTIVKTQEPIAGKIRYGTNVQFGYYDQEQATLIGTGTVLQELWDDWPMMNEKDVRQCLVAFYLPVKMLRNLSLPCPVEKKHDYHLLN